MDTPIPTTYGEDMDLFRAKYNLSDLAWAELQLIVLKASRATMVECYAKFSESITPSK